MGRYALGEAAVCGGELVQSISGGQNTARAVSWAGGPYYLTITATTE